MEVNIEAKTENVEDWTFVLKGGVTATYVIRIDRGEKAAISTNAIDHTPFEVVLTFKDDKTNEIIGRLVFPVVNLLSYGATKRVAPMYATGESPVDLELKRHREELEKRIKAREEQLREISRLN